ncbi:putative nucleotidyltransferase [Comamonas sp. BIGb0152]|uniref:nucleotidyltransferase domain-containing protein n=1 Tax=Comamonas sp. BIGb0152 TaxID=2940601 RepID=UPI0021676B98|nr:nucleotidyltransferase domain-containing protein [Comamonas sp. BIGb0152]MCS4292566.1 putative nucleotidyltransferase [Comamonas sp. BIGb0152]
MREQTLVAKIGVELNGYICMIPTGPNQSTFLAVVDDLRSMLCCPLGQRVDSAYLYGSVARSEAVLGRSDLDVVLVLSGKPVLQDDIDIDAARKALETRHSEVLKVDFDAVNGDFYEVLGGYARRISTESDSAVIARLAREASRKRIRATNVLRPDVSSSWPQSLEDHPALFIDAYPQMEQETAFFRLFAASSQSGRPQVVAADFVERLRAFSEWMRQEL